MRIGNCLIGACRHGARAAAIALGSVLLAAPASAHHVLGGATPSSAWEGFLSGLAHPVLGLEHLAFLVAAGLLASLYRRGALIPVAFASASLIGTYVQALAMVLPAPEVMIATSVFLFGALLIARPRSMPIVVALASAAGIFHGCAYGQSIVGAEMTPLSTYLLGLALVQTAIGLSTRGIARTAFRPTPRMGSVAFRWAGFVVCAVGLGYLSTQ